MLYVSSACVKHEKIKDSVEELALNGFKNIELSGGTKYYETYEEDLLMLKDKYALKYLLHNYFPPPKQDFVLNLASSNEEIYQRTLEHCEKAIVLSRKLGSKKFGLHAGFFIDVTPKNIGGKISFLNMQDKSKALGKFVQGYSFLKKKAEDVQLYIENNVLSSTNVKESKGQKPFMLIDVEDYIELKKLIDCKLLLDVAHLRISAKSLGHNFTQQLDSLVLISDYIHLSENDGFHDQSRCFSKNSEILRELKSYDLSNKTITAETYGNVEDVKFSQKILEESLFLKKYD